MEKKRRRNFTKEFKQEAVKLVLQEGKSVSEVAKDLDLYESNLGNWVRQAKVDAGHNSIGVLTTEEKEELRQLRKENRILRMEREILKKAAAFFAKENI